MNCHRVPFCWHIRISIFIEEKSSDALGTNVRETSKRRNTDDSCRRPTCTPYIRCPYLAKQMPRCSITFHPLPANAPCISSSSSNLPPCLYLTLEKTLGHELKCREKRGYVVKKDGLDKVGNVHGHLLDLSAVELLDLSHHADILSGNEVNRDTLSAETTAATNAVDVVLAVGGQIIVDDQRDLLNVNATSQEVGGNQDTRRAGSELLHDKVTLGLVHITVHSRDSEITGRELVGEPVNLSAGVAEDDSLGDGDSLVQIREGIELPLLLLHSNVELLNTLQGKFILLYEDTNGLTHELGGNLKHVLGHGGGEEDDLGRLRKQLEDIVDLLSETTLE